MAKKDIVKSGTSKTGDSGPDSLAELRTAPEGKILATDGELSPRLNLPVTPEGHFNFASMQAKTRERLAKAVAETPDLAGALAVQVPTIAAPAVRAAEGFKESAVSNLIQMISNAAVEMVGQSHPPAIAALAGLTAEEQAAIVPPATRVINKYSPAVVSKYADELELLGAITALAWTKYQLVRTAAASASVTAAAVSPMAPQAAVSLSDPILPEGITESPLSIGKTA